jgi:hypothetical protein
VSSRYKHCPLHFNLNQETPKKKKKLFLNWIYTQSVVKSVEKCQDYRYGHQMITEKKETFKLAEGMNKERERKPNQ